ncbi:hypothetical protein LBMAG27_05680 [Bacteroidota bacterium]|nr:hypothetical protein LBMAG27_05680 [Bacteroidota bacterium]
MLVGCLQSHSQIIYGANNYTEYHKGTLPIIISVPHGGSLTPSTIPDRTCNNPTLVTDGYTISLARQIDSSLFNLTGKHPHIIYCNLKRTKIDCNREIIEGACGNAEATQAWNEFHNFIDTAEAIAQNQFPGKAFYIDLHGHGHTIQQLELGYLYSSTQLGYSDSVLSTSYYTNLSSIKNLVAANANGYTNAQMLRGNFAFGTLLANAGFPSVPSLQTPSPGTNPYFDGGFNTANYTCHATGNPVNGVQIECNSNVRSSYVNRKVFADSLASVLFRYFLIHENLNLSGCVIPTPIISANGPTTFCPGNSVTLTSSNSNSYLWNTGATTQSILVLTAGTYSITVSNAPACYASSAPVNTTVSICATPTNISSTVISGTSATINWTGNSCAYQYRIQYRKQGTTTWIETIITAPSVFKTLTGLTANSTYEYQIRTDCNSAGTSFSSYSAVQTFITICICAKPSNIATGNISQTSVTVTWTGNSCAYQYRLQYRKQGTSAWTTKTILAPTVSKTLTGLTANSVYEYRMRTDCNSSGSINSGFTTATTFTTLLRLEDTENIFESSMTVTPNPCNTCEIIGSENSSDLIITDILGRKLNATFTKSSSGFYINVPESNRGILLIRNIMTGEVVKFVKE